MKIHSYVKWPAGYQQNTGHFNFRVLLQVGWLGCMVVSVTACCFAREIYIGKEGLAEQRSKLDGRDVVVGYFKDIRVVKQDAPDLCWAASLELALAHQGVDTDQTRIAQRVYPKSDAGADRTLNMFWWHQMLQGWEDQLRDGTPVWVRNDLDGGAEGPILASFTLRKKNCVRAITKPDTFGRHLYRAWNRPYRCSRRSCIFRHHTPDP